MRVLSVVNRRLLLALAPCLACELFSSSGWGASQDSAAGSSSAGPVTTGDGATTGPASGDPGASEGAVSTGSPTTGADDSASTGGEPGTTDVSMGMSTTGVTAEGCRQLDVLFVLDGSATMLPVRNALAQMETFTAVAEALLGLNSGIDVRIGVTTDDDDGFVNPDCWTAGDPWVSSVELTASELAGAFGCAVSGFETNKYEAPDGCEHALTSAVDLLDPDGAGFVRPDALLLLVLVTDVDDYGAYDQVGGNTCGGGCVTPPTAVATLYGRLVDAVKGGRPEAVAAVVIAGDPGVEGGVNACNKPGSCGCGGFECEVFHATRLYEFSALLGDRGVAIDLCGGFNAAPAALMEALSQTIDTACRQFNPGN